jgi:hypothetical protein
VPLSDASFKGAPLARLPSCYNSSDGIPHFLLAIFGGILVSFGNFGGGSFVYFGNLGNLGGSLVNFGNFGGSLVNFGSFGGSLVSFGSFGGSFASFGGGILVRSFGTFGGFFVAIE